MAPTTGNSAAAKLKQVREILLAVQASVSALDQGQNTFYMFATIDRITLDPYRIIMSWYCYVRTMGHQERLVIVLPFLSDVKER